MKNLNQFGVQELNTTEAKAINGGGFFKSIGKFINVSIPVITIIGIALIDGLRRSR